MLDLYRTYAARWDTWRVKSVNRRIFSAIITVGGLTVLVKVAATGKELFVAYKFGTSDALDAYLIAFLLPSFAINVIAGSFSAALIPTFIHVREREGREAAQRLFSNVMVWSSGFLLTVSGLLALSAPYILPFLGSGFGPEKLELTRKLFYFLLPILSINGITKIWASILNSGERFALAALAPIITPVVIIIVLLTKGSTWGIYSLAIGTVGGFILEAGLLSKGIKRHGFSMVPRWHGINPAMKQVLNQYMPMLAGALLISSTNLVDQSMAAILGPGSVSSLSYGNKLVVLILSLGTMAIGSATLPYYSNLVAKQDWNGITQIIKRYGTVILWTTIPLTIIIVVWSDDLVRVIFGRGAFSREDVNLVAKIQTMYAFQIPFYMIGTLIVRVIFAVRKNQYLYGVFCVSLISNILLNYLFMQWIGVAGIALSTSFVYVINLCFYIIIVRGLLSTMVA